MTSLLMGLPRTAASSVGSVREGKPPCVRTGSDLGSNNNNAYVVSIQSGDRAIRVSRLTIAVY